MSYRTDLEIEKANVISLFGEANAEMIERDLLASLADGSLMEETSQEQASAPPRKLVSEQQFPDQSIYTLQEQLQNLKRGLQRLKFYLDDLEDVIPH